MKLDVRIPIGLMMSLMGLLLAVFGATSDPAIYERSLGLNVNLDWGLVLLAFGVGLLVLAGRKRASDQRRASTRSESHGIESSKLAG